MTRTALQGAYPLAAAGPDADVPATVQIVNHLTSIGSIPARAPILDVGCGGDRNASALASLVGHVTGIDPAAEMIAVALDSMP